MQVLLALIVVVPLLGALAALLPAPPGLKGKSPEQAVLRHGVTVTGAVLIAAIVLALGFDHDHPSKMQATTDISWIAAMNVRIHLGIDGISLPLLVLTALLTFLCALHSYFRPPKPSGANGPGANGPGTNDSVTSGPGTNGPGTNGPGGPGTNDSGRSSSVGSGRSSSVTSGSGAKGFVALLLLLESGTLATFAVLDLILFFLAFEMVLIPMYFLIAHWGGDE